MHIPRLTQLTFPPYRFIPGEDAHPNVDGYRKEIPDPVAKPIDPLDPIESECFCFAIDLFNHEYYWESHIYWEALWNAHQREGAIALLFKGLIKLAAARLKFSADHFHSAQSHLKSARMIFHNLSIEAGQSFLGFDLKKLEMLENGEALPFRK